jgi:hypothetical protein
LPKAVTTEQVTISDCVVDGGMQITDVPVCSPRITPRLSGRHSMLVWGVTRDFLTDWSRSHLWKRLASHVQHILKKSFVWIVPASAGARHHKRRSLAASDANPCVSNQDRLLSSLASPIAGNTVSALPAFRVITYAVRPGEDAGSSADRRAS